MKSLTLHALDDQLAGRIKKQAKKEAVSMNELAKRLLAEALGVRSPVKGKHREDFADFCGLWTDDDKKAFEAGISDMENISPEDWR